MADSERRETDSASIEAHVELSTAYLCAAVPMIAGSIIYWTWRCTRAESLPLFGLMTILFGLPLFVLGMISLFRYRSASLRMNNVAPDRLRRQTQFGAALLLVNFPLAAVYTVSAIGHMGDTSVIVANESPRAIENFRLIGPGVEKELGRIRSGRSARVYMDFSGDGPLEFQAQQGKQEVRGTISGYVTGNWGGSYAVKINADDKIEVTETRAPLGGD